MKASTSLHLALLGLALAIAPQARAASVLHTPPAYADDLDSDVFCQIRNVGSSPVAVTIDGLWFDGAVLNSTTRTLAPGEAASHLGGSSAWSCRFTVASSAKKVRALALYTHQTTSDFTHALLAR